MSPRPGVRRHDPDQSAEAAGQANLFAQKHEDRILIALAELNPKPAGKSLIAEQCGLTDVQVSRRLPDLERAGLAQPLDIDVKSGSDVAERAWVITSDGVLSLRRRALL